MSITEPIEPTIGVDVDFTRDGHTIALSLGPDGEIAMRMVCPHEGQLLPTEHKDTPACRRMAVEDTFTVWPTCLVIANFDDIYPGQHFIHSQTDYDRVFHLLQCPLSVEWALVDEDVRTSLYLRPYYHGTQRLNVDAIVAAILGAISQGARVAVVDGHTIELPA